MSIRFNCNNPLTQIQENRQAASRTEPSEKVDEAGRAALSWHPSLQTDAPLPSISLNSLLKDFSDGNLETFEPILQRIEALSKDKPIPQDITDTLVEAIKTHLDSLTESKILKWVHVINQYPSAITLILINNIYLKLTLMPSHFPKLSEFCYKHLGYIGFKDAAFNSLVEQCSPSSPEVNIYPTVTFPLENSDFIINLGKFINNSALKKVAFPLALRSYTITNGRHYCPIYVEKEGENLQFFISEWPCCVIPSSVVFRMPSLPVLVTL